MRVSNLIICAAAVAALSSCGGRKKEKSGATGWNYNDSKQGGFAKAKPKDIKAGPGLVFVQGGTFVMGATEEDVMADWNNVPKRVTVNSFFIDRTEVANIHYREYLFWLSRVFSPDEPANMPILQAAYPDTLVWRDELAYNEPYVEYYFRHPSFNMYPVVGVSWQQAHDFCIWRTDRVNELALVQNKLANPKQIQNINDQGADAFNTKSYLLGLTQVQPGSAGKSKSNPLKDVNGKPRTQVTMEDGIFSQDYRLPTEAEWEYAAIAPLGQNPQPRRKEKFRGEELVANKQVYAWGNNNFNGLRDNRRGAWQGEMLANFKRGSGDLMGVAGGLNDRAAITAPVESFYPNSFGLYNMSGNVSEWVKDVYRPTTFEVGSDFNYFRGNMFKKLYVKDPSTALPSERFEKDSMGRVKEVNEDDSDLARRPNYNHANSISYLDGDSLSGVSYGYGITTLINKDSSRVVKGGSWNDRPYWLSPGTRRFLNQDQADMTIGFRCAMDYFGAPEGNRTRTGNHWPTKRQRR